MDLLYLVYNYFHCLQQPVIQAVNTLLPISIHLTLFHTLTENNRYLQSWHTFKWRLASYGAFSDVHKWVIQKLLY